MSGKETLSTSFSSDNSASKTANGIVWWTILIVLVAAVLLIASLLALSWSRGTLMQIGLFIGICWGCAMTMIWLFFQRTRNDKKRPR